MVIDSGGGNWGEIPERKGEIPEGRGGQPESFSCARRPRTIRMFSVDARSGRPIQATI